MVPLLNHSCVIIPTYNEGKVLARVLEEVINAGHQVIVVDDGSTDETPEICEGMRVHYLRHSQNLGQGAALMTGMDLARAWGARYVVHFDADGQHRVGDIEKLLEPLEEGRVDVVLGSRFLDVESRNLVPRGRRWVLRVACWINFLFTGLLLSDAHNGLRAMNRKALEVMVLREPRRAHATEVLARIKEEGLRWEEVSVRISYDDYARQKGTTWWEGFHVLADLWTSKMS